VVRDVSGAAIAVISGAVPTVTMKANDRSPIARQVIEAARNAAMEPPTFQRNAFVLRLQSRLN
jgi:hypothetical protein